jgi:CelD/BcsL family acetyltransferase involved in cellulose biosynthesis
MVTIEEVADLALLEADWHQLWRELENPTPFQTFAWVTACNEAMGAEEPLAIVAHAPDRVVGILPVVGSGTLKLAGGEISDYQDALVAPGFERMVMGAVVEHFREQPHRWSELHFENLRPESALLYGDFGEAYTDVIEADDVCPTLLLAGPLAVRSRLPQSIPAQQREKVGRCRRRGQKAGKVEIESATFETLEEFVGALKSQREFMKIPAPGLLRKEVLRMYALRLDGKIVATYLGFHCGARSFFYSCDFDEEVRELGVDTILIAHAIEEAVKEGAEVFDFLRGVETFKFAWGAHETHTYCRKIVRL